GAARAAAGEPAAARGGGRGAGALGAVADDLEDLLEPRLDDLRQRALPDALVGPPADAGDRDLVVLPYEVHHRHAELPLEPLGLVVEDAEALADVVGDLRAGDGDDGGVPDRAVLEHGDVGRPAADVDQRHAHLALVAVEDGVGGGQRLEHDVGHLVAGLLDAAVDVLGRRDQPGDDVDVRL